MWSQTERTKGCDVNLVFCRNAQFSNFTQYQVRKVSEDLQYLKTVKAMKTFSIDVFDCIAMKKPSRVLDITTWLIKFNNYSTGGCGIHKQLPPFGVKKCSEIFLGLIVSFKEQIICKDKYLGIVSLQRLLCLLSLKYSSQQRQFWKLENITSVKLRWYLIGNNRS